MGPKRKGHQGESTKKTKGRKMKEGDEEYIYIYIYRERERGGGGGGGRGPHSTTCRLYAEAIETVSV